MPRVHPRGRRSELNEVAKSTNNKQSVLARKKEGPTLSLTFILCSMIEEIYHTKP